MNSGKKTKKKGIPRNTNEMSKEVLMETLKKKKECNARALQIVEKLCETSIDEDWLLTNLAHINQTHFDDVITERAIQKICGYPLCTMKLVNIPAKKYHISTRQNKVYDITERKNFCSNNCYKAGTYLKNQLLTSPLWFRDHEIIPKFKLIHFEAPSPMGEEVVFLPEVEQLKRDVKKEESEDEGASEEIAEKLADLTMKDTPVARVEETEAKDDALASRETIKPEAERTKEFAPPLDPVKKVEQCVHEWFTFDTVLFLYGEDKVKDMLKDKSEELKDVIRKKPISLGRNDKIEKILSLSSVLDHNLDSDTVRRNLKPLPDYAAIREDGKRLELKVRAYYSGQLEVDESEITAEEAKKDESESDIYLPFVDGHEQNALRAKILLERFSRIIPEVIGTFTAASCFDMSELRRLVDHFTLSAHNITFRPGEWYLVGFIVVKLLSVKSKQLESLLKSETAKKHITLVLMNYGLPQDYLDNIMEWLMDPESLLEKLK